MSTRRSRTSQFTEDEINNLIFKLQALLPQLEQRRNNGRVVAPSKILKETCSYIRRLHREMDELSERLTSLLDNMEISSVDAQLLRTVLLQ
ncbi:transcription factor ILI4-like [Rhodamnia argentea]|uniref:Transcription factor ILI4-like n=1 Tax=Rhodamnia argentea TaxID=178133 RepID=A0ABM3HRH1_9MYRT|nr:transcription factor ILI4-like [Rhodamnia argentea]